MNNEMGFSLRTPASDGACLRDDPRGARHWGASSRRTLHMRAIGVKRALDCVTELAAASYGLRASPRLFFSHSISITYRCGPCGVVGDALASSKRSGKSTGFCWPPTLPLARQCVLAALHGDECMDKLKRRCGQPEGSSPLGASSRRKWVHR